MEYFLRTLGALSVHEDGPDGPALLENSKSLALLAYLAAESRHRARRDHLTDLFWADSDRSRARQSLRQALYYLRQKIGARLVVASDDLLLLREEILDVDLWALDRALAAGEYERVVALYGGPFLGSLQDRLGREVETWVEARNERIWTGLKAALHRLVTDALEEDDPGTAVRYARRYVKLNPLDESARTTLIRARVAAGRPLEALRSYEAYRTLLAEDLDDEPGPELRDYIQDLRDRVFPVPSGRVSAPSPAPGAPGDAPPGEEVPGDRESGPEPAGGEPRGDRPPPERDPDDWRPLAAAAVLLLALGLATGEADWPAGAGARPGPDGPAAIADVSSDDRALAIPASGPPAFHDDIPTSGDLPDPTGGRVALSHRSSRGIDLALRENGAAAPTILTRRPHDENPVAWSPDGRKLVYRDGWMGEDGIHYLRRLRALDLESREDHLLADVPVTSRARASWAPSGAWLTFDARSDAGDLDVWIVHPDGSGLLRMTDSPQRDAEPAWSPDGSWIAFATGDVGRRRIVLIRPGTDRVIPLVDTGFDDHSPTWRSPSRLLFLSTRGDETDVWEYDVGRDLRRRITDRGDVFRLRPDPRRFAGGGWIDTLRIESVPGPTTPGQWIRPRITGRGPRGERLPVPERAVRWTAATPPVVAQVGEGSLFRVRAPGRGRVVARIPGWRADTLDVVSRPMALRPCPTLLAEDWSGGLDDRSWYRVGNPEPGVGDGDERFPAVLRTHGDAHYNSGLVSRRSFDTREGLTLEAWARVPLTGRHYQQVALGIEADPPAPGADGWGGPRPALRVTVGGDPDGPRLQVAGSVNPFPVPDSLDAWRRYALQLHPDGRRSVVVDGRILWVEPPSSLEAVPDEVHVTLDGRDVGTDIRVGPVRIYRGVRYVMR